MLTNTYFQKNSLDLNKIVSNSLYFIKHCTFWLLLVLWLANSNFNWGWTISSEYDTLVPHLFGAVTNAFIFYTTAYYLIPALNLKDQKKFWLFSFLIVLGTSVIETIVDARIGEYYNNDFYEVEVKGFFASSGQEGTVSLIYFIFEGIFYAMLVNTFYFVMAFVYRIPTDRRINEKRQQQLREEKLAAQLDYLRVQIHPHTLFNGINSIYNLIENQPKVAKEMLLSLSNSLRYHLYESKEEYVSLERELSYLREYIALLGLRAHHLSLAIQLEDPEEDYIIAPLLFTSFIENAFKYVSRYQPPKKNYITITIETTDQLVFSCTNSYDSDNNNTDYGGIGLENSKKRLPLVYKDDYTLHIDKSEGVFHVKLIVP